MSTKIEKARQVQAQVGIQERRKCQKMSGMESLIIWRWQLATLSESMENTLRSYRLISESRGLCTTPLIDVHTYLSKSDEDVVLQWAGAADSIMTKYMVDTTAP